MGTIGTEIIAFIVATVGLVLVSSTIPIDYWKVSSIDGTVITTATYWSNLWKTCVTDSTGVSNCKDFPSMLALDGYIQAVRGLVLFGMAFGFLAAILCFIGMDCTYIGGSEKTNDKILVTGAVFHFLGGIADAAGYCLFATRLGRAAFARLAERGVVRYEIGSPVYIGLVGSVCIILGSIFYAASVYRVFVPKREVDVSSQRKDTSPQNYVPLTKNKTLFSREYNTSTQSRTSSPSRSQMSGTSQITGISETNAFV
ncbi:claudin-10-like isoform X3 [Brachyhypopomus gauderio]|uniref:claudin-10-like isoform X3 n=1 Tax=Brachyhypopomus gauderio TaxID=698409 RepID=UPI0040425C57